MDDEPDEVGRRLGDRPDVQAPGEVHGLAERRQREGEDARAEEAVALRERERLVALEAWTPEALEGVVKAVSESAQVGMGKVAQPIRVSVTGGTASPGIGETLQLIGREETLRRIDAALASIA